MIERIYYTVLICFIIGIYKSVIETNDYSLQNFDKLSQLDSLISKREAAIQQFEKELDILNKKLDSISSLKPIKNEFSKISRDSAVAIIQRNIDRKKRN